LVKKRKKKTVWITESDCWRKLLTWMQGLRFGSRPFLAKVSINVYLSWIPVVGERNRILISRGRGKERSEVEVKLKQHYGSWWFLVESQSMVNMFCLNNLLRYIINISTLPVPCIAF
jgi:hypothetical protein